jgi:multicomponent Na+:H+ antiporter subunit G
MNETIAYIVIFVGVFFDLFGCVGLVRLPDVYNRLQAATKCVTLGTCLILIGVFVHYGFSQSGILALLAAMFVLITSPTGSHALARGAHKSGVPLCKQTIIDKYAEDIASRHSLEEESE